jgi:hypothetical protein
MKYPLVLLGAAALIGGSALAEDGKSSKAGVFESLDQDADGKLTQEEVAGHSGLASNFDAVDGNSDGVITKREFRRNTMPKARPATGR